jgi:hypothetical protein
VTTLGAYTTHRLRLGPRIATDVGVRYDANEATNEAVWSPRLSASYMLSPNTTLRGGLGRYARFAEVVDVDLAHADTALGRADRATHWALGVEHEHSLRLILRAELYERRQSRVRPSFYRAPSSSALFPEVNDAPLLLAPLSRRTRGAEFSTSFRQPTLGATASYAYALARERFAATVVPGPFDDRHVVHLEWWYAHRSNWRVAGSWSYRSGWAATERTVSITSQPDSARVGVLLGPYNESGHGPYRRLDLRLEREWQRRRVSLFADLYNVLDQVNTHAFEQAEYAVTTRDGVQGPILVSRDVEAWPVPMLGPLFTVGLRWKR